MNILFSELRELKDMLPPGSMNRIAQDLHITPNAVRNFFGGTYYESENPFGIHIEKCPNGAIVHIENPVIYDCAVGLIAQARRVAAWN